MLDFLKIATRRQKSGRIEVYPKFIIKKSSDLMIRGGDFYAVWVESKGLWSTDEQDVIDLVDHEIDIFIEENKATFDDNPPIRLYMWDSDTGTIDRWHKYCQRQSRDNFHQLDEKLIFSNSPICKEDYASKRLSYPLEGGRCPSYDRLVSVLYEPEERAKIEWAIGSVVAGDSKTVQKFLVYTELPEPENPRFLMSFRCCLKAITQCLMQKPSVHQAIRSPLKPSRQILSLQSSTMATLVGLKIILG